MSLVHRFQFACRAAAAAALLLGGLAAPAQAAAVAPAPAPEPVAPLALPRAPQGCDTIVTSTNDLGPGSLRQAVGCVSPLQPTVTFSSSLANVMILLTTGQISLTQRMTIDGSGAPGVKVDGGSAGRVFNITASSPVTLTHLVLQHGLAPGSEDGGALLADASTSLVLNQVQVLSSTAPLGSGGGLFAGGSATFTNTSFISNTSALQAGGAWVALGALISNGRFERNTCTDSNCQGGALNVDTLTLSGTQFISNTASDLGGGVLARSAAHLSSALFQGNQCLGAGCDGGGLFAFTTLGLSGADFINNNSLGYGGGAMALSTTVVTNGSFQGNQCFESTCSGGGLIVNTSLTVTGTQFISNTAGTSLGGAGAIVSARLTNARFQGNRCTDAGCQAGGFGTGGPLTLVGTDFINNTSLGNGGGALVMSTTLLTNGHFQGNRCTDAGCEGGGLYAGASLTLAGTEFISNTSLFNGAGARVEHGALLTGGRFQGNECTGSNCSGGGLAANDWLTATGTQLISNTSTSLGAGVAVNGPTRLTNARFQNNQCTQTNCGGGGLVTSGALVATSTDFISNTSATGGGGAVVTGVAQMTNGTFQGNRCTQGSCVGGGLYAFSPLTLTLTHVFFSDNSSLGNGGAVMALGAVQLAQDRFEGNACSNADCLAGGLFAGGAALISSSSFSDNQAGGYGGALAITGTTPITLANVTLSGNLASVAGGGLYAGGASQASLWNVTVADNQAPSGAGLRVDPGASIGVTNTLFANNIGGNCAGAIAAGTHNLQWPDASCAGPGFTTADPLLAPLALNAPGTTLTRALANLSPARDHGDAASCAGPLVNNLDQRGVVRPIDGDSVAGAVCDIGAYEASAPMWFLYLPLVRR